MSRAILQLGLVAIVMTFTVWSLWPLPFTENPWAEEITWADFQALQTETPPLQADTFKHWLPRVDPLGQFKNFMLVQPEGIKVYESPNRQTSPIVIPFIQNTTTPAPTQATGEPKPLMGVRIALDPGHFGGAWSEIEHRHYPVKDKKPVKEGDLTYATALHLKQHLEAQGAEIILTRQAPPTQSFDTYLPPHFDETREAAYWLRHQQTNALTRFWLWLHPARIAIRALELAKENTMENKRFKLFKFFDLRRRSQFVNSCKVDLTLSLHYNASTNRHVNHLMLFLPGNFMAHELQSLTGRYYGLRRLLENSLHRTHEIANHVAHTMGTELKLPLIPAEERINRLPLKNSPGVYARNLALLKRTQGPVLLIEGPFMTNTQEYDRLVPFAYPNTTPNPNSRPWQMATAIARAIQEKAPLLRLSARDKTPLTEKCAMFNP
ncbi:MAG: N-acetylmuramoyl-L-alanine amidase [Myxococcota bacterium]|nr:N-acetylmuramoyl-L-alanine amidase [Myxococcota bacterium]